LSQFFPDRNSNIYNKNIEVLDIFVFLRGVLAPLGSVKGKRRRRRNKRVNTRKQISKRASGVEGKRGR